MKNKKVYNINIVGVNSSWMNVSSNKSFWIELLETWMNFVTLSAIIFSLFGTKYFKDIVIAFLLITLSLIAKRKIKKIIPFSILNLALLVIACLICSNFFEQLIYILLLGFQLIVNIRHKYNPAITFFNLSRIVFDSLFFTVLLMVDYCAGGYKASNLLTVLACSNIIIGLIYIHITRTDNLMKWETNYAKEFSGKIFNTKLIMSSIIGVAICFVAGTMFFTRFFYLADLLQKAFLGIFDGNSKSQTSLSDPYSPTQPTKVNNDFMNLPKASAHKNVYLEYLWIILQIAIVAAAACFLIYIIWLVVITIRQNYRDLQLKRNNEERESTLKTENLSARLVKNLDAVGDKIRDMINVTNQKKIRKLYYKLVLKKKKRESILFNSDTPLEIKNKLADEENNLNLATQIYEKARYSNLECRNEEVEQIKKLL